jgi:gliding motility-associated-like protein
MKRKILVSFLALLCVFFYSKNAHTQLIIDNQGATAEVVVNSIISGGLTITNATMNCPNNAYGTFTNGATTDIGIPTGLVMTTGNVADINAPGANFMSTDNGTNCNDPQLNALEPLANNDCCILEFDVVPTCDELQIRFVFGSEEYPEWVSSGYNDAFGFFISGPDPNGGVYNNNNVAVLPDGNTIVSIDNVNANLNQAFYVNNATGTTNVFDAFTTVLISDVSVVPCESYHFKLAIADAGDPFWDSGVFVDFLECSTALETTVSSTPVSCAGSDGTASVNATGGFPGYTYNWNTTPPQTTPTATGLDPGIYEVSVDDAGGCTEPIIETVEVVANAVVPTLSINSGTICAGDFITLTASPSIAGGSFLWNTGETTASINVSPNTNTSYTCEYDLAGCIAIANTTVTVNPLLESTTNLNICETELPFLWNGMSLNTSGTHQIVLAGLQTGCDSTATIELAVAPTLTSTTNLTICEDQLPFVWNGLNFLTSGNQTVSLTSVISGCDSLATLSLTVQSPTLGLNSEVICEGSSVILTAVPSIIGGSYSWSNGETGVEFIEVSPTETTSYTCDYDLAGCMAQASGTVTVNPILESSISFDICESELPYQWNGLSFANAGIQTATLTSLLSGCDSLVTLDLSVIPPATSESFETICDSELPYLWNGLFFGAGGTQTVTLQSLETGCDSLATLTLTVTASQVPDFDQLGPYCQDDPADALPNISNDGITGVWGPPGINTNAVGPTIYAFVVDPNQCALNYQMVIQVNETPDLSIIGTDEICEGQDAILTAVSGLANGNFYWLPNGETTNEIIVSPTQTTQYTATYSVGGCPSPVVDFTVIVNPNIPVYAGDDVTLCLGESIALNGSNGINYSWSGGVEDGVDFAPSETSVYTLTGFSADGCETQDEVLVEVLPLPVIDPGLPVSVCEGELVVLSASGLGIGGTYNWDNGASDLVPFNLNNTTTYTVTGIDENGCQGSASVTLTAVPNPIALFQANPISGAIPLNVDFINQSSDAFQYSWDFGNEDELNYVEPANPEISTIYESAGVFNVQLIAQNDLCSDTFSLAINALEIADPIIFVPNVFSPNQDGTNELFLIDTENIATIELIILNRWGNIMARIESLNGGWDGRSSNGNDAKEGVYFYKYTATGINGSELSGHGFLTLVR